MAPADDFFALQRFACRVTLSPAAPRARFRVACKAPQLKPDASSLIVASRCLDLQVFAMYFDAGRSQVVVEELLGLQVIRRAQRCNFAEHLKLRGCPGGGLLTHWQRCRLAVAFRRTLLRAGGRLSSDLSRSSSRPLLPAPLSFGTALAERIGENNIENLPDLPVRGGSFNAL